MSLDEVLNFLPDSPDGDHNIWYTGDEILCRTFAAANAICEICELIFNVSAYTGYYDPEEDIRNDCVDAYTGWYYVGF